MEITQTVTGLRSENSLTRGDWYAIRTDDIGATMRVSRVTEFRGYGKVRVTWSGRARGRWWKNYQATFSTEAEAMEFAAKKWPVLLAWIAKQPEQTGTGAGAAGEFSQMVASMRRVTAAT